MQAKRPVRVQKTSLSNEQVRFFEELHLAYEAEKSGKSWAQWLADYQQGLAQLPPLERSVYQLHRKLFKLELQLERIESAVSTVVDRVAPTITFDELKTLFDRAESAATIQEWLAGHGIAPDATGCYRRVEVMKAYGNAPREHAP